ncbi:hypothetical protein [Streptomyces synnematoformans]|uniref:Protein-L-isoaspartate O-methyltransferase n=1 Tax=Streptomyces synnematoformans TaxID=415721 RepID=A0ABP5J7Q0_9ACTN
MTPDTPSATDAVARAAEAIPAARFHGADGGAVRPCTPAHVTHRHLRMLDVRPGMAVQEIGTGSGLSAALLAHLVGTTGSVTTVEISTHLARRAMGLYAEHGHQVNVVVGDGLIGHPEGAPYHRVFVGTTPPAIPNNWLQQLAPGGILLTGVRISDLPGAYAIARITVDDQHLPSHVEIHHGGYTPMSAPRATVPLTHTTDPDDLKSTITLLGNHPETKAAALLDALHDKPHVEPTPAPDDEYLHLKNWIIASAPEGLLEATLTEGPGIGLGAISNDESHAALITDQHLITDHPDSSVSEVLRALIHRWQAAGAPRTHELHAELRREGDVWHARITLG